MLKKKCYVILANAKTYMPKFTLAFGSVKFCFCRNASDVSTCVQNIASPDDLSFDVKNFTVSLRDDFIFGCSPGLCFLSL